MKIAENLRILSNFAEISIKKRKSLTKFCKDFQFRGVQRCDNRVDLEKMLKNEYLLAKIGADTEENEPSKV